MCRMEKICVLRKLHSGVSHGAVGHEFNVSESTMRNIQKKEEEICRSPQAAALVSAKVKSIVSA